MNPILHSLLESASESCTSLREAIVNVRPAGFSDDYRFELIAFEVVGDKHVNGSFIGRLDGRNRDLCLGLSEATDKAIAARVLIDGHAAECR